MAKSYDELKRRFEQQQAELEQRQPAFVAYVGDGTTADPRESGEPNYLWVRSPGRGIFPAVYNPEVPVRNDIPVWVGPTPFDPDRWEIRSIATQYTDGLGEYAYQPHHAPSHILFDDDGGDDVVWHQKQQGVFLLAAPTDPLSMKVFIHTDFYLYQSSWRWWPGAQSASLAGYLPAAGSAKYVLIVVDAQTNTLEYVDGNEFPVFPPVNPATHIPALPAGKFPSVAVYLTNSTTSLDWENLFDVRLLVGGGADTTLPAPHPLLHPATHDDTHTGTPPVEGAMIRAKEDRRWTQLFIGTPNQLLHVAPSGSYPEWASFEWGKVNQAAGADMVHDHSSAIEGGGDLLELQHIDYQEIDTEIINNTIFWNGFRRLYGQLYAADNLDFIVSGTPGAICWITGHPTYCSAVNPVTVRHAVGNLRLHDATDFVIDGPTKNLGFVYTSAGYWIEMGRPESGGGGVGDHIHSPTPGQGGHLSFSGTYTDGTAGSIPYLITGGFIAEDPDNLEYEPITKSLLIGERLAVGLQGTVPTRAAELARVDEHTFMVLQNFSSGTHQGIVVGEKSRSGHFGILEETLHEDVLLRLYGRGVSISGEYVVASQLLLRQYGDADFNDLGGFVQIRVRIAGVGNKEVASFTPDGLIINAQGWPSLDTRMESDHNEHMFHLDAGEDHIRIGKTGSYVHMDNDGDVWFAGGASLSHGEIYNYTGTAAVTMAAQDTWYQVTSFTENGLYKNSTPDHTNDHITVGITGRYLVTVSIGTEASGAVELVFGVFTNNGATRHPNISTSGSSSTIYRESFSLSGFADLTAGDTVELWVQRTQGGASSITVTPKFVTMSIVQIGS